MGQNINDLLKPQLQRVEDILANTLTNSKTEAHVNAMCQMLVASGGKRMRPKLALLTALAQPHYEPKQHEELACDIAAAIELLHTATLIHDDVIDKATTRRGVTTINETDGNHVAVLAGDYLFTRCFSISAKIESFPLLRAINQTISALVAGEISQLKHEGFIDITIEDYFNIIYCKTGALFELASMGFACATTQDEKVIEELKAYGRNLGIAFQIVDDILDYSSDATTLGKPVGEDLDDQRITLPIIIALQKTQGQQRDLFIKAIENADFDHVKSTIINTNALNDCYTYAHKAANEAKTNITILPNNKYKEGLFSLIDMCINRKS